MQELRGKIIADQIKGECLDFVGQYNGILPALAILRVGHKEADLSYERSIKKRFMDFGLEAKDYELPENVSNEEFQQVFDFINQDPEIHGILVMRPLPKQIDEAAMLRKMNPLKDLDGITAANVAGVMRGDADAFAPCTAQAVVEILKGHQIEMAGKEVCIIGRSMVVGKPLSMHRHYRRTREAPRPGREASDEAHTDRRQRRRVLSLISYRRHCKRFKALTCLSFFCFL